jgi:rod shape-determining protein MreC
MENFFSRYKNPLVLMAILFIQVVALATQVKRPEGGTGSAASGGTRLIRVWTVTAISPFERALVSTGSFVRRNFYNYIDLHNVRKQNRALQAEVDQLKLEQVRLQQDAEQAKRLRALLGFTQHYVGQLLPAQVIGTSGTELSHMIQIDKGSRSGVKVDMPVITPDGIVGKVKDVFPHTSLVLLISDRDSGAGVILQNSRLQGVLRGSPQGELRIGEMMSDEKIEPGEEVVTSGGDRIYPKGLPVGTVSKVSPDKDNEPFLAVKVKPAADLNRLEEVLVVTKIAQEGPDKNAEAGDVRAADILAERLPSIPKPDEAKKAKAPAPAPAKPAAPGSNPTPKTTASGAAPTGSPHPEAAHSLKAAGVNAQQKEASKPPSTGNSAAGSGQPVTGAAQTTKQAAAQTAHRPSNPGSVSTGGKKTGASAPKPANTSTQHTPGPKPSATPRTGAPPDAAAPASGDSSQPKPAGTERPPR